MSEPVPPVFALERVEVDYEGIPALREISLSIDRGESIAVLGANGSGKTTFLRLLDGLVSPAAGSFMAFGEPVTAKALRAGSFAHRLRRRIGLLFQNADAQLFSATVREEIAFGPLQLGLSGAEVERRTVELASMLSLGTLLDRPPFRLSGGEKRRVALASVLATGPEVLLLDEPTGQLDPRGRTSLLDLLLALRAAGRTLVMATNDLDAAAVLASRVIVLDESHRVAADGPAPPILGDEALLARVNVLHAHGHWHGAVYHRHAHAHAGEHEHAHGEDKAAGDSA